MLSRRVNINGGVFVLPVAGKRSKKRRQNILVSVFRYEGSKLNVT